MVPSSTFWLRNKSLTESLESCSKQACSRSFTERFFHFLWSCCWWECFGKIGSVNVQKVVAELKRRYPNKKIIKNGKECPTEILCEVEPSGDHPEYSLVVSVLDKSIPHVHKQTTENYKILKGVLKVFKDGQEFVLEEGDKLTVRPGEVHWAEGKETWFECHSQPGWTPNDHILIGKKGES